MTPATPSRRFGAGIWDYIGRTPLIPLRKLVPERPGVKVYAKAEWFNPGGSVKDRAAWWMLRTALEDGRLRPGKVILDSTSGNTGIAYAMLGTALG